MAASTIICKNAAKRCIEIIEFANETLATLLGSYLLTVRQTLPNYAIIRRAVLSNLEVAFHFVHASSIDGQEAWKA